MYLYSWINYDNFIIPILNTFYKTKQINSYTNITTILLI